MIMKLKKKNTVSKSSKYVTLYSSEDGFSSCGIHVTFC